MSKGWEGKQEHVQLRPGVTIYVGVFWLSYGTYVNNPYV